MQHGFEITRNCFTNKLFMLYWKLKVNPEKGDFSHLWKKAIQVLNSDIIYFYKGPETSYTKSATYEREKTIEKENLIPVGNITNSNLVHVSQNRRRIWWSHVVVLQSIAKKCTKFYNARAEPLHCHYNLLCIRPNYVWHLWLSWKWHVIFFVLFCWCIGTMSCARGISYLLSYWCTGYAHSGMQTTFWGIILAQHIEQIALLSRILLFVETRKPSTLFIEEEGVFVCV